MSKMIGPIHHWLYRKIEFQEEWTQRLLKCLPEKQNEILAALDREAPTRVGEPLEEVIDPINIHGSLQQWIEISEARFAAAVESLLSEGMPLEKIKEESYLIGTENPIKEDDVMAVYRAFMDRFLDGMPCDHANRILMESDDEIRWERTIDLHCAYWHEGFEGVYDELREALAQGMLKDRSVKLTPYRLRKES